MVKLVVLEKLLGMRQVLKLNKLMDMSPQSKNLFKMQAFLMVTKGLICGQKKKKKRFPEMILTQLGFCSLH